MIKKQKSGRGTRHVQKPKNPVRIRIREEAPQDLPETPLQTEVATEAFGKLWDSLFRSSVHLDSALSKLSPRLKSALAELVPLILLRPGTLAEQQGVGVAPGEPWGLSAEQKAVWSAARQIFRALHEQRTGGKPAKAFLSGESTDLDFPPAMLESWRTNWGEETCRRLVQELGRPASLSLRASAKLGADGLLSKLKEGSWLPVRAGRSSWTPFGVVLDGYAAVLNTELYRSGMFEIQDEGSQWMSLFALWPELFAIRLSPKPGGIGGTGFSVPEIPTRIDSSLRVVDACAGAGGKSLAMADALRGGGRVFAYDTVPGKLQALRRRATTAKVNNIQTVALPEGREEESLSKFAGSADVVLVDAPCSGWGVLRRNSDIKWRQSADALDRMPEIQNRLIGLYSQLVKPGGRLVFGVCTFRAEETHQVVERFLKNHSEFEKQQGGFLGPGPCDGFFMQAFRRKA